MGQDSHFRAQSPASARPGGALGALSDERLQRRLHALAWGEKQVLVAFLRHLDEFDHRRAYAPRDYPSLFKYCTGELALSEDEAYLRIQAARLARDFPEVLEMLGRGETHLSSLAKLSPHLTPANAAGLLTEARGKSKREVERIAARYGPPPPRMDAIRFFPPPPPRAGTDACAGGAPFALGEGALNAPPPQSPAPVGPPANEAPKSAASPPETDRSQESRLVRICFTASEDLLRKIERARALLRHKYPMGRLEQLADEAFDALLAKRDPDRRRPSRPGADAQASGGERGRRGIPRRVQDQVWRRDGGRCAFAAPDGRRCQATDWLEYDHVLPFALGGSSRDPANIRLLCKAHNGHAARNIFGAGPWRRTQKQRKHPNGSGVPGL